ncbi:MAG: DEAD/DEAH box helicase [Thermodesulforhabdaceae bacterium]
MAIQQFIKSLKSHRETRWEIVHHAILKDQPPDIVPLESALPRELSQLLRKALSSRSQSIRVNTLQGLYHHQAEALKAIRSGKHVVVSTPMASGKSLIYYLAFAEALLKDPQAKALFIFPIKALSRDQLDAASSFFSALFPEKGWSQRTSPVQVYDGDTSTRERALIRDAVPPIIITNPDMLHYAFLPYHSKWQNLWKNLRLVVLDEIHTYRGVFGSHVAQILRRLQRIQRLYSQTPNSLQFILLSATIGNPQELSSQLTGIPEEEIVLVNRSSAPLPLRHFVFLKSDYPMALTASWILAEAVEENLKTIVFTRSRRMTELIFLTFRQRFPKLAKHVSSYRAGLLPSDRREIERKLSQKKGLLGIISTSAMELGVDIGDLDVCVLAGYPGTIMNTWQRAGRVGRSGQESAIILLPQADALDQYIISHPDHILSGKAEIAVADTRNFRINTDHILCAAAEYPIQADELERKPHWFEPLRFLKATGRIVQNGGNGSWSATSLYPHRLVDIRQTGNGFTILLKAGSESPVLLGSIDGVRAFKECHPGAVYLHLGETYEVTELDLSFRRITVRPFSGPYFTMAITTKETEILEVIRSRKVRNFVLRLGRLKITEQVVGYEKKSVKTLEVLGRESLDLPPQCYETVGLWIEIDPWIQELVKKRDLHFMGGIHALEHALISMFPLLILCDRGDIGGIAYPFHPKVQKSAVFIYDGYEGGIGICEKAFDMIESLFDKVICLLDACDCAEGCPMCIHSPRCGSGNKPLDKEAAKLISRALFEFDKAEAEKTDAKIDPEPLNQPENFRERSPLVIRDRPNIAFFDLETQFLAHEVGGWNNAHLMRISVAVIYDELQSNYLTYREEEINKLIERLSRYDLVVGFNIIDFDYKVLAPYAQSDLKRHLPTFDMLKDIHRVIGRKISLDHLAAVNLKEFKLADGIQAVRWFREGKWNTLVDYCCQDVMLTRKLFYKGIEEKKLSYLDKKGVLREIAVSWSLDEIVKRSKSCITTEMQISTK